MADILADYQKLKQQLEEEKRGRLEERQAREEAQRETRQTRRELSLEKRESRRTNLLEYVNAFHTLCFSSLAVQTNANYSTKGDPANASEKFRPDSLRRWDGFLDQQQATWLKLCESSFALERQFSSLGGLKDRGEDMKSRVIGSEADLTYFQRSFVELPVSNIAQKIHDNAQLKAAFKLKGAISFENHANLLSADAELRQYIAQDINQDLNQLSVSTPPLPASTDNAQEAPKTPFSVGSRALLSSRPRADQFCVYYASNEQGSETRIAAFVAEYKAPHKLPLNFIYDGLQDMELEDVLQEREVEDDNHAKCRLIAAVITQAFSYMVSVGAEYGCVSSGEATIFLQVPQDPRTVYYHLSVPKGDFDEMQHQRRSGADADLNSEPYDASKDLYLTAVGQMLAFSLNAVRSPPRSQIWRQDALRVLKRWQIDYSALAMPILSDRKQTPSSEYRPGWNNRTSTRDSPVNLRSRRAVQGDLGCRPTAKPRKPSDEDDSGPESPSQRPSLPKGVLRNSPTLQTSRAPPTAAAARRNKDEARKTKGSYCTQNCLRGLKHGGQLDETCPNSHEHGEQTHQISQVQFLHLIRQQLARDLDNNCQPVGQPGSCGVLFRIRLASHGYTVAAKCTLAESVYRLRREATIYSQLSEIQGIHVPVHLGNIDLHHPYYYDGGFQLVHMMFVSFGGMPLFHHLTPKNLQAVTLQVGEAARAIHALGILHNDLLPRNMLWSEETQRVMIIDFERAKPQKLQPRPVLRPLSEISRNEQGLKDAIKVDTSKVRNAHRSLRAFDDEVGGAADELRSYVASAFPGAMELKTGLFENGVTG